MYKLKTFFKNTNEMKKCIDQNKALHNHLILYCIITIRKLFFNYLYLRLINLLINYEICRKKCNLFIERT